MKFKLNNKNKAKIFCLGLSRTGTTSLEEAFKILGYNAVDFFNVSYESDRLSYLGLKIIFKIHKILGVKFRYFTHKLYKRGRLLIDMSSVENYEVLRDIPIARFYKELDVKYPNSKFILTTREENDWLGSCQKNYWFGRFGHTVNRLHFDLYNEIEFNRESFIKAYNKHIKEVLSYFKDREKDLLIINIPAGEGWDKLCPFLNKPIPKVSFPRKNVSKKIPVD